MSSVLGVQEVPNDTRLLEVKKEREKKKKKTPKEIKKKHVRTSKQ